MEFFNAMLGHYFISASSEEISLLETGAFGPDWERSGRSFAAWSSGSASAPAAAANVYRFYSYAANSHFYTADAAEVNLLRSLNPTNGDLSQWVLEGEVFRIDLPAGGVCAPPLQPIYRSYNNRAALHDMNHRIVGGAEVMSAMEARGWVAEGVVMCSRAVTVDAAQRAASSAERADLAATVLSGRVGAVLAGGQFTLSGVTVDGANAVVASSSGAALGAGVTVTVTGYPAGGKLIAIRIEIRSGHDDSDDGDDDDGDGDDDGEESGG